MIRDELLIKPLHPVVREFLATPRKMLIGGAWVDAEDGATFTSYDPSTGEPLAQIAEGKAQDIVRAVDAAREAFDNGPWRHKITPAERSKLLWRFADLLERDAEIIAQLDSLDNGKPYTTALAVDGPMSVDHFRYYAGWPTKIEGSTIPVSQSGFLNYTVREPVGVCGLITPWNYPTLMPAWKLAPALAMGNVVILKPAEQTPLSALYLGVLFTEAGFPPGVVNIVTGFGETAGAALAANNRVDKIGFTGSTEVARKIIHASEGNIKRLSLELGGKSPNIVFADANLDKAANGALWAIFGNNGQSCTAGSRLFVERPVFERVVESIAEAARQLRVGPGMSSSRPNLGPVVSDEQLARVMGYISEGKQSGAEVRVGGERIGGELQNGYFVTPTILTGVNDRMSVVREEIFGPVVAAMPFDDISEIVRRANDTDYGLGAAIWTRDIKRAHRVASALQAGTVWINTYGNTDPASPFGGYKQSGYGREMGAAAIDLYTQLKSVWVSVEE